MIYSYRSGIHFCTEFEAPFRGIDDKFQQLPNLAAQFVKLWKSTDTKIKLAE